MIELGLLMMLSKHQMVVYTLVLQAPNLTSTVGI